MAEKGLVWELLSETGGSIDTQIHRARVPGGWLVLAHAYDKYGHTSGQKSLALTFYPDPSHEWDGGSPG